MQNTVRINTFVGFAVKANKVVWGADNLLVHRKKLYLVLASADCSANTLERVKSYCEKKPVQYKLLGEKTVAELTHREGCKVIGITDKSLSDAIIAEINKEQQ